MKKVLIDTDILSYFFKGHDEVTLNFKNYLKSYEVFNISIITYYEIISGLQAKNATNQLIIFEEFCEINSIFPLTKASVVISAKIYAELKKAGKIVDDIDLLIAGVAIENDLVLVTNNTKHFSRIPDLQIENWSTS